MMINHDKTNDLKPPSRQRCGGPVCDDNTAQPPGDHPGTRWLLQREVTQSYVEVYKALVRAYCVADKSRPKLESISETYFDQPFALAKALRERVGAFGDHVQSETVEFVLYLMFDRKRIIKGGPANSPDYVEELCASIELFYGAAQKLDKAFKAGLDVTSRL